MSKDILPFLAIVAQPTRPFGTAIPSLPLPEATSPWSPKPDPAAAAQPTIDVEAIRTDAMVAGRAEGLRETERLRAQLQHAIAALDAARAACVAHSAELIGDAAATVIEGWIGATDRRALFAPLVRAWIENGSPTAKARCHPADVDALRAEIGDAAITVEADPAIARGDLVIADSVRELAHDWSSRLRELREAIAAALATP